MAPEVYNGRARPESDLWAVGVLLHWMLTQKLPFRGKFLGELEEKIKSAPPEISGDLSEPMRRILLTALAKDPGDRYASASAMSAALSFPARCYVNIDAAQSRTYKAVFDPSTIFVVAGRSWNWGADWVSDQLAASLIEGALIRAGRLGIIVSDVEYLSRRSELSGSPAISVGGPASNALTKELNQRLGIDAAMFDERGKWVTKMDHRDPAIAVVWGRWAVDTLKASAHFIEEELPSFLRAVPKADVVILSPHTNDAFICMGAFISDLVRLGKNVRVIDVFSATNFSSFYVGGTDLQATNELSRMRKWEELANAQSIGARVAFLDLPEASVRKGARHHSDLAGIWVDDPFLLSASRELSPVVRAIEEIVARDVGCEVYAPLGLCRHIDHVIVRDAALHVFETGGLRTLFFYEDLWPFSTQDSGLADEFSRCGIYGEPRTITEGMTRLGVRLAPRRVDIDIARALSLMAAYFSETEDATDLIGGMERFWRTGTDDRHAIRYWQVVDRVHPDQELDVGRTRRTRFILDDPMKAEQGIVGWENDGNSPGYSDRRFQIEFSVRFSSVPFVHASVELMDLTTEDKSTRLRVEVENVSTSSATIHICCWDVSRIWGCRVRWLAIGE
jgi:LmbE family N-acetylglucosaminyl deacetylase